MHCDLVALNFLSNYPAKSSQIDSKCRIELGVGASRIRSPAYANTEIQALLSVLSRHVSGEGEIPLAPESESPPGICPGGGNKSCLNADLWVN